MQKKITSEITSRLSSEKWQELHYSLLLMTAFLTTTIHKNGAKNFMKFVLFIFYETFFCKFDFRLKTEEYKFLEIVITKQEKIMRLYIPIGLLTRGTWIWKMYVWLANSIS